MSSETKSIRQRAEELQRQLGHGTRPAPTTAPAPAPIHPDQLVTPPEYAGLWAQSEAIVVTAVIDAFLKWAESFTLQPCKVQGAMVHGTPGCVTADPVQLVVLPAVQAAEKLGDPAKFRVGAAKKFCEQAVTEVFRHLESWVRQLAPMGLTWYPAYAAPMPHHPPGQVNLPCPLAHLGRAANQLLEPMMLEPVLHKALDKDWAKLYQPPGPLNMTLAGKVCTSIAGQLSKFLKEFCANSQVVGINAHSTTPATGQPMPFMGQTEVKRGFVSPVVAWRPDWNR